MCSGSLLEFSRCRSLEFFSSTSTKAVRRNILDWRSGTHSVLQVWQKKKKKKINSHHYIFRDLDGHQVSTHKPFSLPGQIMQLHRIPGIVALSLKNCYSLHSRPKKTKVQINATACSTKTNLIKHTRLSQLTFYHVQICVWLIAHYWLVPWKFITLFDTQLKRDKFMSHWH